MRTHASRQGRYVETTASHRTIKRQRDRRQHDYQPRANGRVGLVARGRSIVPIACTRASARACIPASWTRACTRAAGSSRTGTTVTLTHLGGKCLDRRAEAGEQIIRRSSARPRFLSPLIRYTPSSPLPPYPPNTVFARDKSLVIRRDSWVIRPRIVNDPLPGSGADGAGFE